jgi:hypothetical protein
MSKVSGISIITSGQNYIYYLQKAVEIRDRGQTGSEEWVAVAEDCRSNLLKMRRTLVSEAQSLTSLGARCPSDLESGAKADRLLERIDQIDEFLSVGEGEGPVSTPLPLSPPTERSQPRGSYDGGMVKSLMAEFGMGSRHVINTLNLSGSLDEGWDIESLVRWFREYRKTRKAGACKRMSVATANILAF